jgi:hypothetical protein
MDVDASIIKTNIKVRNSDAMCNEKLSLLPQNQLLNWNCARSFQTKYHYIGRVARDSDFFA